MQTFLATQIALSALPLLLFVSFSLVTLILVAVAAIALTLFWIGAALLILVPTLFATGSAALFIWIWAVGTYVFCRYAYRITKAGRKAAVESRPAKKMKAVADGYSSSRPYPEAFSSNTRQKHELDRDSDQEIAPGVPEVVKRSLNEAHEPPEAAANPEAVEEKKAVERELTEEEAQERDHSTRRPNGYHDEPSVPATAPNGDAPSSFSTYDKLEPNRTVSDRGYDDVAGSDLLSSYPRQQRMMPGTLKE